MTMITLNWRYWIHQKRKQKVVKGQLQLIVPLQCLVGTREALDILLLTGTGMSVSKVPARHNMSRGKRLWYQNIIEERHIHWWWPQCPCIVISISLSFWQCSLQIYTYEWPGGRLCSPRISIKPSTCPARVMIKSIMTQGMFQPL